MEELDLTKVLNVGDKVYSTILGEGIVESIDKSTYPINVKFDDYTSACFTACGQYIAKVGECVLFPSKKNRDWSTYRPKERRQHKFKPFERVLCRDNSDEPWTACLFSHQHNDDDEIVVTVGGHCYRISIPYEGNENLLGTKINKN